MSIIKRAALILTAAALCLSAVPASAEERSSDRPAVLASAESRSFDGWMLDWYMDEFRLPSDKPYLRCTGPVAGIFNRAGTAVDAEARLEMLADDRGFSLILYENGQDRVTETQGFDRAYDVAVRDGLGRRHYLTGTMYAGGDFILLRGEAGLEFEHLLGANPQMWLYIAESADPDTNYLFTLESTGDFKTALAALQDAFRERDYREAVRLYRNGRVREALEIFTSLDGYRDSAEWEDRYRADMYERAEALLEEGRYAEAAPAFAEAGDYRDAAERAGESYYAQGLALLETGDAAGALTAFTNAGGYADAPKQVAAIWYDQGVALRDSGDYDAAAAAFGNAAGYMEDAGEQISETRYRQAAALEEAGDHDAAAAVYATIAGYKDVDEILAGGTAVAAVREASAGDIVTYGAYEQDNDLSNGAEPIEWIVLSNDGESAMLISRYGLDAQPYNTVPSSVTWETCTLRAWLNGDFRNAAFSAKEQDRLETVTVTADRNPKYRTDPGSDTQDTVFLLSIGEAQSLFSDADAGMCRATAYAAARGAYVGSNGNSWWWLRSPGYFRNYAAYIYSDGSVGSSGLNVDSGRSVVRPVVVLRLS